MLETAKSQGDQTQLTRGAEELETQSEWKSRRGERVEGGVVIAQGPVDGGLGGGWEQPEM